MIEVEVSKENAKEVLKRKQDGEDICPKCTKEAFEMIKSNLFAIPKESQDE